MQLQTIVSRRNKATHPLVLTFGEFHGGSAPNIIPDEVLLRGTMRCMDNAFRLKRLEEIRTLCHSFCQSMGAQCEVVVEQGMPPLENAEDICTQLAESSRKVLGADCVVQDFDTVYGFRGFLLHVGGLQKPRRTVSVGDPSCKLTTKRPGTSCRTMHFPIRGTLPRC